MPARRLSLDAIRAELTCSVRAVPELLSPHSRKDFDRACSPSLIRDTIIFRKSSASKRLKDREEVVPRITQITGIPFAQPRSHLQRQKILDEVPFLLIRQTKSEEAIVVIDHIAKSGKAAVMIEAVFLVGPQALQR